VKWLRLDAAFDSHPDVKAAGFWGSTVYLALLRTSALFDLDGSLPAKYASGAYVAAILGIPIEHAEGGLESASSAGLIHRDDAGTVAITGWERFQNPEAVRKRYQRKKTSPSLPSPGDERTSRDNPGQSRNVPDGPGPSRLRNDTIRNDTNDTILASPDGDACPTVSQSSSKRSRKPTRDCLQLSFETWTWEGITDKDRTGWSEAFPGIDLDRELAAAREWVRADPAHRRKVRWRTFLTRWFGRAQDNASRGNTIKKAGENRPGFDRFGREYSSHAMAREWGLIKTDTDVIEAVSEEVHHDS